MQSDLRSVVRGMLQLWQLHRLSANDTLTADQVNECMDQSYYRLNDDEVQFIGILSEEMFHDTR